jgi:hypothetical protein
VDRHIVKKNGGVLGRSRTMVQVHVLLYFCKRALDVSVARFSRKELLGQALVGQGVSHERR